MLTTTLLKLFDLVTAGKLLHYFISLMSAMRESLMCNCDSSFKIPHLKKEVRCRAGNEINEPDCSPQLILRANEFLAEHIDD